MRLFIAIELPEEIKGAIGALQDRFRASGLGANWTRPEGIHLTLKFLGDVEEKKIDSINAAMEQAAAGTGALRLSVSGAGAFPDVRSPRVVWLGLSGDIGQLSALQADLENAMIRLGFEREARPFTPHLTLARIKFPRPRDDWQRALAGIGIVGLTAFTADRVSLMQSELHSGGAVYRELRQAELK